ncbi:hypothetical protein [Halomonas stenophila]|uniref:Cytochrome c domain-containing protein n=1 Tax=Halomonas stenophila TaxID=795312 RepID=A0A7W5N3C3_9GAMM|nr:hypothetical protein [Halomonas stenophila]MBB3233105.1 hypothetical protein [Halomonas stenophila]
MSQGPRNGGEDYFERPTHLVSKLYAGRLRLAAICAVVLLSALLALFHAFPPNRPVEYTSEVEHFYYGSIGSDITSGIPLKLMQVLPKTFPDHLPKGAVARDYTAFGMIQEPGRPMPIGFSVRDQIVDRTWINCAVCHTGSVRESPEAKPRIIAGMSANTVDLMAFFKFLFDCADDPRFTADTLLAAMDEQGELGPVERLIYRIAVPQVREELLKTRRNLAYLFEPDYPPFGPGRVDTFNTFKFNQFAYYYQERDAPVEEIYGTVDFPSIWEQAKRDGLWLHWDGNNNSVRERNFSAAIGAGTAPPDMDVDSLFRLEDWLDELEPPAYPFAIDEQAARRGRPIYEQYCFSCHDFKGEHVGGVVPLEQIGTDRHRKDSYTEVLRQAQRDYTKGYFWQFSHFRVTDGYANHPLDGLWARAPYLHNGSVPSLWDLLTPRDRPEIFTIGNDVYDPQRMGFAHQELKGSREDGYVYPDGRPYTGSAFVLDTRLPGNGNEGHSGPAYGTELSDQEKRDLIEYLKWLSRPQDAS